MSRQEYLATLRRPSTLEVARITEKQIQKEREINDKYQRHTAEENEAATRIQKAYRGHRERRQLEGLTLDPSSRWTEALKELKYRSVTASQWQTSQPVSDSRSPSPSDQARHNWRRAAWVAEHASAGESGTPEANNSMLMDLRYFLEMTDTQHRYGANLQVYHAEWKRSQTKQNFFLWLDHGEGSHLDLPGCSREKLERERIRYLSREERKDYLVRIDSDGKLRWRKNDELITTSGELYRDSIQGIVAKDSSTPAWAYEQDDLLDPPNTSSPDDDDEASTQTSSTTATSISDPPRPDHLEKTTTTAKKKKRKPHLHVSPATLLNHLLRASVKPGTWIYVVDTLSNLYIGIKTSGAFQHASFLSGARILSAGSIGIDAGQLTYLSPLSGHYRPTTRSFRRFVERLGDQGVDLRQLRVSRAYEVLVGMECYGKAREGLEFFGGRGSHLDHDRHRHQRQEEDEKEEGEKVEGGSKRYGRRRRRKGTLPADRVHAVNASAADFVEQRWDSEHEQKAGLRRLLGDLHLT
ncbi:hypothetical protein KC331_g5085 [Hortaea werneckii]|uniref:IQ calmodulin-binding motif protein n=1 Tax=Hortaea werneckii TaxID=91943 RepID=A0A3M7BMR1_HORWE|nr:hypothetical protein KC331_g5085 [Hortaea werneckii]KAI7717614.1 hypothetical protein KC353_g4437 [Hortaea werneckii]RMY40896.1 hypothetical protein D0865_12432 [Hortaea werneckii]